MYTGERSLPEENKIAHGLAENEVALRILLLSHQFLNKFMPDSWIYSNKYQMRTSVFHLDKSGFRYPVASALGILSINILTSLVVRHYQETSFLSSPSSKSLTALTVFVLCR